MHFLIIFSMFHFDYCIHGSKKQSKTLFESRYQAFWCRHQWVRVSRIWHQFSAISRIAILLQHTQHQHRYGHRQVDTSFADFNLTNGSNSSVSVGDGVWHVRHQTRLHPKVSVLQRLQPLFKTLSVTWYHSLCVETICQKLQLKRTV